MKPALLRLPPERVHDATLGLLRVAERTGVHRVYASHFSAEDERLAGDAFGQSFSNPVGLAAGFDENAQAPRALGFGSVEDAASADL